MLKKSIAGAFLNAHYHLFECPLCRQAFSRPKMAWFVQIVIDLTYQRKAHFSFLDHQVKADYDQALFLPRQRMIASGMYAPVLETIKTALVMLSIFSWLRRRQFSGSAGQ